MGTVAMTRIALLLGLLLLSGTAHAAPFLQSGADAARTGVSTDAGPVSDDVAFRLMLPGARGARVSPVLLGGTLFLATGDPADTATGAHALVRVDLATAAVSVVAELPAAPSGLASDGARIFVADGLGVAAHDAVTGREIWRRAHAHVVASPSFRTDCIEPAVRAERVFVACTQTGSGAPGTGALGVLVEPEETRVLLSSHATASGDGWTWIKPLGADPAALPGVPTPERATSPTAGTSTISHAWALSIVGDAAILATVEGHLARPQYWGIAAEDGSTLWTLDIAGAWSQDALAAPDAQAERSRALPAGATGVTDTAYLRYGYLVEAVTPLTGENIRFSRRPAEPVDPLYAGVLGLAPGALLVGSGTTLSRLDATSLTERWTSTTEDEFWRGPSLLVSGGAVYGRTVLASGRGHFIVSHDLDNGTIRQRFGPHEIVPGPADVHDLTFGVGEGVLVASGADGSVIVYGRTPASIDAQATTSSLTPARGETVHVDLSGSRPGVFGPATAYRVEWGDGTVDDWQESAQFTHVYQDDGEHHARLSARNDAGQTASTERTFAVGATPPAGLGWARLPFLGLLLVGAAVLVLTARRRRAAVPLVAAHVAPARTALERYRIDKALGEGAFARTYLARDLQLGRPVVLKTFHAGGAVTSRVLAEAQAMARIHHPNVVTLLDVARDGAEAVLVMELVDGGSLRDRLARGPLGPEEFARVGTGVLAALAAVHDAGLVHRDVKPANILLTVDGKAKLTDFGVAHVHGLEATMDGSGAPTAPIGTLRYMSPEQAQGLDATRRSDLYAAALTLFEAWTGEAYLTRGAAETPAALQARAARPGPPVVPASVESAALRAWFARALQPDPAARFASAEDMDAAFRGALIDLTTR